MQLKLLHHLHDLNLSHNFIVDTTELSHLKHLSILNLSHNRIIKLNAELKNVEVLILRSNLITRLRDYQLI